MKITDSIMSLQSSHSSTVVDVARESLQIWQDGQAPSVKKADVDPQGRLRHRASMLLQHPPARAQAPEKTAAPAANEKAVSTGEESLTHGNKLEVSLIKLLVERFTGHRISVVTPGDLRSETAQPVEHQSHSDRHHNADERQGWGMVYQNYRSHSESEQTSFQAQGVVRTADGREIAIDVQLNMSREFFSESLQTLRAGDALKDPLVVNFSGNASALTKQTFTFDIDADGNGDQIHFVTPESGFLALDKNQDGVINNGSELFGALSGNGFADLAKHDSDRNGWIDESDPIFEKLRIWSKDAAGNDQLVGLGAKGIGAIYLGHVTTPFDLKDENNQLSGVVRDSGLYLQEAGGVGTLQQVDLVV
jgi:hypothetical protein